jgi:DNA-directed RNA polymerase subunit RPC12/RpoP
MIPVRYMCAECGEDLGVYWQGVGDESEPKPHCPKCGNENNFSSTTDPNVVQFGW